MKKLIKLILILLLLFNLKSFSQAYEVELNDSAFFDIGKCFPLETEKLPHCGFLKKSVKDGLYKIYYIDNYSKDNPIRYLGLEIQVIDGRMNGTYKAYLYNGVMEKSGTIKYIENESCYIRIGEWLYYDVEDKEPYKIKYHKVKYREKDKKYLNDYP